MDPRKAVCYLKADGGPSTADRLLSKSDAPVCRQLCRGLLICYVVDTGSALEFVQRRHLEAAGMSEDELHMHGLQNLAALASAGSLRAEPYGSVYAVFLDGNFEASLILLDQLWEEIFRSAADGDFIVALPARDVLSFTGSNNAAGIRELHALVERCAGGDHPLSDKLFRRTSEGHWCELHAADDTCPPE